MIKRTLLLTLAFFLAYNFALQSMRLREYFYLQSMWDQNLARTQDFVLAPTPPVGVLVGSSLSVRLTPRILGPECRSLAFAGGSALAGLELMVASAHRARWVLIEINYITRGADDARRDSTTDPRLTHLRSLLPALRVRYKPANFLAGWIGDRILNRGLSLLPAYPRFAAEPPATAPDSATNTTTFARASRDNLLASFAQPPSPEQLRTSITRVRQIVRELERRGTRCIFVEMPVDPALTTLPWALETRKAMQQAFPPSRYPWVQPGSEREYATTDGLHLDSTAARVCSQRLKVAVDQVDSPTATPAED